MLRRLLPLRVRRAGRLALDALREPSNPLLIGGNDYAYAYPDFIDTTPPADLLTLGRHSYHRPQVEWHPGEPGRVRIGAFCSIHPSVRIFTGGSHRFDWITSFALRARLMLPGRFEDGETDESFGVEIGNDVYVGTEAMILSGVRIGDGAVVAARTVVTRDVPAYAIVAGSPAALRRYRFGEPEREALARVRWWDWDDAAVVAEVGALCSPDVADFLRRHDARYAAEHPADDDATAV